MPEKTEKVIQETKPDASESIPVTRAVMNEIKEQALEDMGLGKYAEKKEN